MRIASRTIPKVVLMMLVGMPCAGLLPVARGDGPPAKGVDGAWKLNFLGFGSDELAIIRIETKDGARSGKVVTVQKQALGGDVNMAVEKGSAPDSLAFTLKGEAMDLRFDGKLAKDGPNAGHILGTLYLRGEPYPARLDPTTADVLGDRKPSDLIRQYLVAARLTDPKAKVEKLKETIQKNAGNPTLHVVYGDLLDSAEAAGLSSDEVKAAVADWFKGAEPYGPAWAKSVRFKALKSLGSHKPYAELALGLAQQVDKETDEKANAEEKAAVVGLLARAATLAGKADIAKEAGARSAKLEALLDEEYHHKVPPFKPEPFKGRKDDKANRVVLMELFTGAQCPPCVAADVAFDALLTTFKPSEFIGLQYHLHIPGPDPLTNADTVDRQKFYGDAIRGTPSMFFNGRPFPGGGGFMMHSENKYNEFRQAVEKQLANKAEATIKLTADRIGDVVNIDAVATLAKPADAKDEKGEKDDDKGGDAAKSKVMLRLALTEESIRYVGGNKLRYHHHVVRDFPGGIKGKALESGSGEVKVKLNLGDLKREIEGYLSESAKKRPFPNPLPEIEFKDLSVVAFVQDDSDKSILGAVSVPVKLANP